MKRKSWYWVIGATLFIASGVFLRVRYFFARVSTDANAPTILAHQIVVVDKFADIHRNDLVFFATNLSDLKRGVFRLVGVPGDVVQITDGNLLVNGTQPDTTFSLSHSYRIFVQDTLDMQLDPILVDLLETRDSIVIPIADKKVRENRMTVIRYIIPSDPVNAFIQSRYHQKWNLDYFGPITLPPDAYFVLGDNRSKAFDSRYFGWIKREQILGTVCFY